MEFLFDGVPEVSFLLGHDDDVSLVPCAFGGAFFHAINGFGLHELQLLLQLLVGQELVTPLGQRFLDLVAQALSEFHVLTKTKESDDKKESFRKM